MDKNRKKKIVLVLLILYLVEDESLTADLFSLNEQVMPNPVLRISGNIDLLFEHGYLEMIGKHNANCLISTLTLLKKRFFKLNLF